MDSTSELSKLAMRWQELREQGLKITAEELCADRPELVGELRSGLAALKGLDCLLGAVNAPVPPSAAPHDIKEAYA